MKGAMLIHQLVLDGKLSPRAGAELLMLRKTISGPYRRQRLRVWHRLHRWLAYVFGGQSR